MILLTVFDNFIMCGSIFLERAELEQGCSSLVPFIIVKAGNGENKEYNTIHHLFFHFRIIFRQGQKEGGFFRWKESFL